MVPGLSVFPSREPGMPGNFWMSHEGHPKGVRYRVSLHDGTWDFPWDAVPGKGLILRRR